jgi:anthranilate 1,2-dioxygenase large subunit/terephthalate 1,2-dioxygenase oxygenase component alpha subunit
MAALAGEVAMDAITDRIWPAGLTRVPYWVYTDADIRGLEQKRLFEGPVWNFLCLEIELPNVGDYRTTFVGSMPVVVVRAEDGELAAFENRCAHRGALICLDDCGSVKDFQCVYHSWRYDLHGNLRSVAFSRGVNGKGGMPAGFDMTQHGPRKLRVTTFCGMVFGTLSAEAPRFETWLGPEIAGRVRRVLGNCKLEIIGRFTQALPNNWKLYFENVRDTYHASLLHLFFTTFRITRLTSGGGVLVSDTGEHHASATLAPMRGQDSSYSSQGLRADKESFRLADPTILGMHDEFHDEVLLQILSIFPGFVLQQVHNALAVRQIVPRGVDATDLNWTYLGFADDAPELRAHRLRQNNLVGPAGFVSMEDGAVGGFVQRGIAAAADELSVINMGGDGAETQETRATEASVRAFWKAYRMHMGL